MFSTSKKIACRVVGRRRSGAGGGMRVAKTGSGASTATRSPVPAGSGVGSGDGGDLGAGRVFSATRRGRRLAFFRSMPRIIRDRRATG